LLAAEGGRVEVPGGAAERGVDADGGLRAAVWAAGEPPGRDGMRDVLGL